MMNQQSPDNSYASARRGLRHVFVQNLTLPARIGVHAHERAAAQKLTINLDVAVLENAAIPAPQGKQARPEKIGDVVCYEKLVQQIEQILHAAHYDLIETLADVIADALMQDKRIAKLRIRLGKPQAIAAAENVGIEIERLGR